MSNKRPHCASPFRSVKFFVLCHSLLQLILMMTSSYLKGCISTIEKRFGFSSQVSDLVIVFNELGRIPVILFVSYFGSRAHRPCIIGCGVLIVTVATFIMSLPKFILGLYEYDHSISDPTNVADICSSAHQSELLSEQCTVQRATESQKALSLLLIGQALLGIGTVPVQPFGLSFIDDFASKSNSPLYLGISFAGALIGPVIASVLVVVMLRIFVDIDQVPAEDIHLTYTDPRWVGAWWLGFILTSALAAISAVPYFFFPKELRKEKEDPKTVTTESGNSNLLDEQEGKPEDLPFRQFVKRFPMVLVRNLKNLVVIMVIMALVSMNLLAAGSVAFLDKFLQWQFIIPASEANMLLGAVILPVSLIGILLGGVILKTFHMSVKQIIILCITCMGVCILFAFPLFFIGCPPRKVAGLDYSGSAGFAILDSDCNRKCNCSPHAFNPVCGQDRVEYISPCHAGCTDLLHDAAEKEVMKYTRCGCIIFRGALGSANPGKCPGKCSTFQTFFMVFNGLSLFMASLTIMPSFMLILRSVRSEDKSFAIGIHNLIVRISAWVPASALYATVVDSTCLLWQWKCQKRAHCRYYNKITLHQRYVGLQVCFDIFSFLCFVAVYYFYRKGEGSLQRKTEGGSLDGAPETASKALDSLFSPAEEPTAPTGKP